MTTKEPGGLLLHLSLLEKIVKKYDGEGLCHGVDTPFEMHTEVTEWFRAHKKLLGQKVSQIQFLDFKTIKGLVEVYDEWLKTFRAGTVGHQESYNKARDTRHEIEDEQWVKLSDVKKALLEGS